MPNWCNNYLHIDGPEEDLVAWDALVAASGQRLFGLIIPTFPGADTRESQIDGWGTKWDIDLSDNDPAARTYYFDSAWSPPINGFQTVSLLCPRLTFCLRYSEEGAFFAGFTLLRAGAQLGACDDVPLPTEVEDVGDPEGDYVENPDYIPLHERWEEEIADVLADADGYPKQPREHLELNDEYVAEAVYLCRHCVGEPADHVNQQCLFGSTKYEPHNAQVAVLRWREKNGD